MLNLLRKIIVRNNETQIFHWLNAMLDLSKLFRRREMTRRAIIARVAMTAALKFTVNSEIFRE